ncbi:uncharacterized protein LOC135384016 isoform X2 [Ornithodoros turicata]
MDTKLLITVALCGILVTWVLPNAECKPTQAPVSATRVEKPDTLEDEKSQKSSRTFVVTNLQQQNIPINFLGVPASEIFGSSSDIPRWFIESTSQPSKNPDFHAQRGRRGLPRVP